MTSKMQLDQRDMVVDPFGRDLSSAAWGCRACWEVQMNPLAWATRMGLDSVPAGPTRLYSRAELEALCLSDDYRPSLSISVRISAASAPFNHGILPQ